MMRRKDGIAGIVCVLHIIMVILIFLTLVTIPVAASDDDTVSFTMTDVSGEKTSGITNLYLSYYTITSMSFNMRYYDSDSSSSIKILVGDKLRSINFYDIKEVTYTWTDTDENAQVTIVTTSGEQVTGHPSQISSWEFIGNTDYSSIRLNARDILSIIRDEIHIPQTSTTTPTGATGQEKRDIFTLLDLNGVKTRNIQGLYLYYYSSWGGPIYFVYDDKSSDSVSVEIGKTRHSVPLSKINEISYSWADTDENSRITLTTLTGLRLTGQPIQVVNWEYKGNKDSETTFQFVRNTSRVVRSSITLESILEGIMVPGSEGRFELIDGLWVGGENLVNLINPANLYYYIKTSF
jgi:hypothetical protein